MDTVTRLWLQLVLEFFENNGRLFSIVFFFECLAVVHIKPFFSRPEKNIANFLFVVGVFEHAFEHKLTFLFEFSESIH